MLSPLKARSLLKADPRTDFETARNTLSEIGPTFEAVENTLEYDVFHTVTGGIERVRYKPRAQRKRPPLLMVHGMWHAAFCWEVWQQGWESVAISLPGHGRSPEQRPVAECSLAYYLRFVADEVASFDTPPVLFGHSMGGALTQWYLKYVGELLGAVFVASWTSHDILKDCIWNAMKVDPLGTVFSPLLGWQFQFRNDNTVRKWFLSEHADAAAHALRPQLGPESEIVLPQHRPPSWQPPKATGTPKLWICAGNDAIVPTAASHRSADHYAADLLDVPESGHDIMLDPLALGTIEKIDDWLTRKMSMDRPPQEEKKWQTS